MSQVVWKYELPASRDFTVEMPCVSTMLSVQIQGERPVLWALVDPEAPKMKRRFIIVDTGKPIEVTELLQHVATFQGVDGKAVIHLFAVGGPRA